MGQTKRLHLACQFLDLLVRHARFIDFFVDLGGIVGTVKHDFLQIASCQEYEYAVVAVVQAGDGRGYEAPEACALDSHDRRIDHR